ncbi:anti-sigma factor domain-containing protein [Actinoplanes sp. NPDC051859]|uniref:anti-sigma factor n=1 Tax=Actinoplanes sp. NPDC051859 TaxID=3363909 RepID=UPI00379F2B78
MTTTDVHALAGVYALHAADDLECVAFERHLAGCAVCLTETRELRETGARLAASTWSVPPRRLRADVMTAVARTRQIPPTAQNTARTSADPSRWRRYSIAAAAAVVLAAGTGVTVYGVQEQRIRDQSAAASAAGQREDQAQGILTAPDVVLKTTAVRGGGTVTVASSASRHAGVVALSANIRPARNQALQLWTIRATTPTSAAVLPAGQSAAMHVIDGLSGADAVGVTLEPAGGSLAPTTPAVALIRLR